MTKFSEMFNLNQVVDNPVAEIASVSKKEMAIIGISALLPKAETLNELWQNIIGEVDCCSELPEGRRKDAVDFLHFTQMAQDTASFARISYLEDIDKFDYRFFNLTPREAALLDPNQRIFLETAWRAIEDAGYGGDKLFGSRTGVYIGFRADDFYTYRNLILGVEPDAAASAFISNLSSIIAGRISYLLDLKGPSMCIDTACSSSLVAVHTACQAIRNQECDMAIAGGIRINVLPLEIRQKLGVESSDGKARTFDDDSDGTGLGEGSIAVLIKPLHKALRDGDHVYAVIKGSNVNQDGSSVGLTAPNVQAQEDVILRAWKDAAIDPETISYIEAHGTGTKLGDPIEIDGIQRAFRRYTEKRQFCAISSVKTVLGHLDNVAGIAGLLQAVLALKHQQIPPNRYFNKPNRRIVFEESPIFVSDHPQKWESEGLPRRCGISSFGLSGTNCHLILEEAPPVAAVPRKLDPASILCLSAKSENALQRLIKSYQSLTCDEPLMELGDVCFTANTGRGHYGYRLALIIKSWDDLRDKLNQLLTTSLGEFNAPNIYLGRPQSGDGPSLPTALNQLEAPNLNDLTRKAVHKINEWLNTGENQQTLLNEIGSLYVQGAAIPWDKLYQSANHQRLSLPVYPFERDRCWLRIPEVINTLAYSTDLTAITWLPQELEQQGAPMISGEKVLVFHDTVGIGKMVTAILRNHGNEVIEVYSGPEYRMITKNHYEISFADTDYAQLIASQNPGSINRIFHLASITDSQEVANIEELMVSQHRGVYSLFFLVKAIAAQKWIQHIDLAIITQYANGVTGTELRILPENGTLHGLAKVIGWELPQFKCNCIDIDGKISPEELIAESFTHKPYPVAYRNGKRYVEQLDRMEPESLPQINPVIQADGVYLITGGTGGIGMEMGKYLASKGKVKLALISRTPIPPRNEWDRIISGGADQKLVNRIKGIRQMETMGAEVDCYRADVSRMDEMKAVFTDIKTKYGRINGIVHCAGLAGEGLLINKEYETFNKVLAPKVFGTWILNQLTQFQSLEFFLNCSSVVSLSGAPGQGDYTAANSYLDAFAAHATQQGRKMLTINWPIWKETGMAFERGVSDAGSAFKAISTEQAFSSLDKIWDRSAQRVIIGDFNYENAALEQLITDNGLNLSNTLKAKITNRLTDDKFRFKSAAAPLAAVKLTGNEAEEYSGIQRRIAEVWRKVLGFEEINIHANFFDIGGTSLMITQLHSLMEEAFPGKITVVDLFSYPTITEIANYISSIQDGDYSPQTDTALSTEENVNQLFDQLEKGELSVDSASRIVSEWRRNNG